MTTATTTLFRAAFQNANKKGKVHMSHSYTDRVDKSGWKHDTRRYVNLVVHGSSEDVYKIATKVDRSLKAVGLDGSVRVSGSGLTHYIRGTCTLG